MSQTAKLWSLHAPALMRAPILGAVVVICSLLFLVVLALDYLYYQRLRKGLGPDIPIVGDAPYLWRRLRWTESEVNLRGVLQRGYDLFSKNFKPWAYWGQHDGFIVVMPPDTCDEIKNVGTDKLSFLQAVEDSYHFRLHTRILGRTHVDAIRLSVNKNMKQLQRAVTTQGEETIPEVLDHLANEKKSFAGFLTIWHLVHTVATSFLIGPEFARNTAYMREIEKYCLGVPDFVHLYFWLPAPLRNAFWWLSPYGFRIRSCIAKLKRFILPELRRRIDAFRQNDGAQGEYTLLDAMLALKVERGVIKRESGAMDKSEEERQIDIFAEEVIFTAFDSAGPVSVLITQLIFETIRHNEIKEPLRKELLAALAANDFEWSDQALCSTPRLESFTRETMRADGPTLFSVTRSVMQPFQLKSAGGLALRPGTIISSPAWLIHNDSDNYDNANEFNPYRFYDAEKNTCIVRATTTSNKFLAFGYGLQMCPGRYLGVRMAQTLFAKILMRYDFDFEHPEKGKPENVFMPGQVLPEYHAKLVLKMRE